MGLSRVSKKQTKQLLVPALSSITDILYKAATDGALVGTVNNLSFGVGINPVQVAGMACCTVVLNESDTINELESKIVTCKDQIVAPFDGRAGEEDGRDMVDISTLNPATENPVNPTSMPANTYFHISSMWVESDGRCLEAPDPSQSSGNDQGVRMNPCNGGNAQRWKLEPTSGGYFKIKNAAFESRDLCLEGNSFGGVAFMTNCANATGQIWKLVENSAEYNHLQAMFFEADNHCLEGNMPGSGVGFGGASHRTPCGDYSGQLFKFIKAP